MNFDQIGRVLELKEHGDAEVAVVVGLGFVGAGVAAALARARRAGRPPFFVIGLEQPSRAGETKVDLVNRGKPPLEVNDPELAKAFVQAVQDVRNLVATTDAEILTLADVVIVCVNLDLERAPGQTEKISCDAGNYVDLMRTIGGRVRADTLVIVESTLPVGTCDKLLYPAFCEGREAKDGKQNQPPLFAYCYERVTPGSNYLNSVDNYWRAYAGIDDASAARAESFLSTFVDTASYPLWRHKSTRAAEVAKLLENAYRAANIAFIDEWTTLADDVGIDLFDVIESIRVRKGTHDNIMGPGLGVGGYCLTKDALLAVYGAENLLGVPADMPFSRRAILVNEAMPLRCSNWLKAHFGESLNRQRALLVGVTYRTGVGDTRHSPSEILARALIDFSVEVTAFDGLIRDWDEMPDVQILSDIDDALDGRSIVVICLPDPELAKQLVSLLPAKLDEGATVLDPWNAIGDAGVRDLIAAGITYKAFGRGDLAETNSGL